MVDLGIFDDDDDDDDVVCVPFFLSGYFCPTFQKKKLEQEKKNPLLILEKFQMKKME